MEEKELQKNYEILADILIAKTTRYALALAIVIAATESISDILKIIDINKYYLVLVTFINTLIMFVPSFIYDVLNKHEKKFQSLCIILISAAPGLFFTAISHCNILIFSFPIIISCFYNDKKLVYLSGSVSAASLIISHSLKYFAFRHSYEEFGSYSELIIGRMLPELFEMFVVFAICLVIATRFTQLIEQMLLYTNKLEQKQEDINILVDNSSTLIDAQKSERPENILHAIVKIIENLIHKENVPYVVGMLRSDETWDIISNGKYSFADKSDHIHIGFIRKAYSFYFKKAKNSKDSELFMHDIESVAFPIYDNDKLEAFAVFSVRIPVEVRESLITANALIAKAVSNCILNNKMFATQEELVSNLAEICEAKSEQTGQHVKRIAKYMEIFGDALNLDSLENKIVSIASMLHDIGKLTIPIEILDKPGKLTDEEYEIIKSHTKIGYDMLKNCSGLIMQHAADMALQHHERWDGRGYNKFKGEEIEYYSRYVAVADVFDALASKRSYKRAWTNEEVRDEIVRCKGTQFCPDAVDKFVENFDKFVEVRNSMPDEEE